MIGTKALVVLICAVLCGCSGLKTLCTDASQMGGASLGTVLAAVPGPIGLAGSAAVAACVANDVMLAAGKEQTKSN